MQRLNCFAFAAIQSHEEAWERHVQDSLSLLPALEKCLHGNVKPASIIDVRIPT